MWDTFASELMLMAVLRAHSIPYDTELCRNEQRFATWLLKMSCTPKQARRIMSCSSTASVLGAKLTGSHADNLTGANTSLGHPNPVKLQRLEQGANLVASKHPDAAEPADACCVASGSSALHACPDITQSLMCCCTPEQQIMLSDKSDAGSCPKGEALLDQELLQNDGKHPSACMG